MRFGWSRIMMLVNLMRSFWLMDRHWNMNVLVINVNMDISVASRLWVMNLEIMMNIMVGWRSIMTRFIVVVIVLMSQRFSMMVVMVVIMHILEFFSRSISIKLFLVLLPLRLLCNPLLFFILFLLLLLIVLLLI